MVTITIRGRRPRPTLRSIALAVAILQRAEAAAVHAERDQCFACFLGCQMLRARAVAVIPDRLLQDREWVHRHVEMPAMRVLARMDDEHRGVGRG